MESIDPALAPALAALAGMSGLVAIYRASRERRQEETDRRQRVAAPALIKRSGGGRHQRG